MKGLASLIPEWLMEWLQVYAVPFLEIEVRRLLRALLQGIADTFLFLSLPLTISVGSQAILNTRYHLSPSQQQQIQIWGGISSIVAYMEDVPTVVPLVLWYKEAGLREENPANCEGIMGLHTAVKSGELPCFPKGSIGPWEIAHQLRLGASTFKKYCPEISYNTTNPRILKRCYLYYNAGPASRMAPNDSAYVMNGYDKAHQNMIHTDIEGRRYTLQAMGAWPVHLAIQAQLSQQKEPLAPPVILAPALLMQEALDKIWIRRETITTTLSITETTLYCRAPQSSDCFIEPHTDGEAKLRPGLSPLLIKPIHGGELKCGMLAGVDLTPPKTSVVLAPTSGDLTRYMDQKGHLAVHIENDEWSVWLTGLRSYATSEGAIQAGDPIGAIGGQDSNTPLLHYAIYDKIKAGFVDPMSFMPLGACPTAN
jgi:hypothetical protein